MAGNGKHDFVCIITNSNLSRKQNIASLDLQTGMEVEPLKITRQYKKAGCRLTAGMGFYELSRRENGEIVCDLACLFNLLRFASISVL